MTQLVLNAQQQPSSCSQYKVYWLHLDNHSDPSKEGYIGITKKKVTARFREHVSRSKSLKTHIAKAFSKYGVDNIKLTVLCITDKEHARYMEKKLRPEPFMGWNMSIGGMTSPEIPSEVRKAAAIKAKKVRKVPQGSDHPMWAGGKERWLRKNGLFVPKTREEWSANISKGLTGRKQSEEAIDKQSKAHLRRFEEMGWWVNSQAREDTWLSAGLVFVLRETVAAPKWLISEITGMSLDQISKIASKLNQGWNPLEDNRWIEFYDNKKDQGEKSIEELKLLIANAQR